MNDAIPYTLRSLAALPIESLRVIYGRARRALGWSLEVALAQERANGWQDDGADPVTRTWKLLEHLRVARYTDKKTGEKEWWPSANGTQRKVDRTVANTAASHALLREVVAGFLT